MDKPPMSPDDAEASEKLVDGDKIVIRPQLAATPQNGDTRIDMVEVRQAFVGMGKEELMKFANDPFWVKLRWFLFGLFWVLWFGMLFGAVAIIAYAPKCTAPAEREWFESSPLYLINADQIRDEEGKEIPLSKGLSQMKDHLTDLGIKSILLDLNSENADDFMALPKKYGSPESLKETLSELRESGIHTFLKIVPNHASTKHSWFVKSVQKEEPYVSYFVWAKGKDGGPPSNWNTFDGQSAWTMNDERGEYYLHQENSTFADLNFRNPELSKYFSDVFKHWLSFGFCGIHLEKVAFLVEDENLEDEHPSPVNDGKLGDYNFFTHSKTANLDKTYDILREWAAVIANSSGILSVDQVSDSADVTANLIQRPFVISTSHPLQHQLTSYISEVMNKRHQVWTLDSASTSQLTPANVENINLLFLLLPNTTLLTSGLEIGQVNKSDILRLPILKGSQNASGDTQQQHLLSTFKKVVELRESPSITYGKTNILTNSSVLLITRVKQGNPGYLISLNVDTTAHVVDVLEAQAQGVGENLKLVASSSNFKTANLGKISTDNTDAITAPVFTMPASSFAVLEYVVASS